MTTGDRDAATSVFDDLRITGYTRPVEIGHGGFAVVYRARRVDFAQDVAIKVLTDSLDEHARGRFDRERRVLGALAQHPNIVTLYDSGTTPDGAPYLVMEYLAGGSLAGHLDKLGPLEPARVIDIAVKLCGALETAHRTGVLHRDIKPDNVLMSRYGEPVLADFGIARMQGQLQTQSGVVTATLNHAPPEVLDGTRPSPQSDVYSLGSTLYALLSGRAPFVRDTDASVAALLTRLLREPPPDLRPRGVPADLCALLERSMAKEVKDRPRSALDFGRAFQDLQRRAGTPVSALVVEQVEGDAEEIPPTAPIRSVQPTGTRPAPSTRSGPHIPTGAHPPHVAPRHTGPRPGGGPPQYQGTPSGVPAPPTNIWPGGAQPPQPPPYSGGPPGLFGGQQYGPPPFHGYGQPAKRPPWFWPVVAGVAVLVLVLLVAVAAEGGFSNFGSSQVGDTFQLTPDVESGGESGSTGPVTDLESLLLTPADVGPGGDEPATQPVGDIAAVLWCSRPAPDDGKIAEAKRSIALPSAEGYQVHTYLAAFAPGTAATFMDGLLETATRCAQNSTVDEPERIIPPPGGEQAVRVTAQGRDVIWVRYGDHVLETNVAFTGAVDPGVAPAVAARAVGKVVQGTS